MRIFRAVGEKFNVYNQKAIVFYDKNNENAIIIGTTTDGKFFIHQDTPQAPKIVKVPKLEIPKRYVGEKFEIVKRGQVLTVYTHPDLIPRHAAKMTHVYHRLDERTTYDPDYYIIEHVNTVMVIRHPRFTSTKEEREKGRWYLDCEKVRALGITHCGLKARFAWIYAELCKVYDRRYNTVFRFPKICSCCYLYAIEIKPNKFYTKTGPCSYRVIELEDKSEEEKLKEYVRKNSVPLHPFDHAYDGERIYLMPADKLIKWINERVLE